MERIILKSATNGLKRAESTSIQAPPQMKVLPRDWFYGRGEDRSLQAFARQTRPEPGAPGDFHGPISARPPWAQLSCSCPKAFSCASLDNSLSIAAWTAFKHRQDKWHRGTVSQELYVGAQPSFLIAKLCHAHQESQPSPTFTCNQAMRCPVPHPDRVYSTYGQTLPDCHSMLL